MDVVEVCCVVEVADEFLEARPGLPISSGRRSCSRDESQSVKA